jgi:hypothetical protein
VELDESSYPKMSKKGRAMGILAVVLKTRGAKLRKFNIHVEDYMDIIELRKEYFHQTDEVFKKENNPKKAFKELNRVNNLYLKHFQERWDYHILERFCQMQQIHNVIQRKRYE